MSSLNRRRLFQIIMFGAAFAGAFGIVLALTS
jgi:hypothetical protein